MAATVSNPQISFSITANLSNPAVGSSTSTANVVQNASGVFTATGSGTGAASKTYDNTFTIASTGSPVSVDLTSLIDPLGNTIVFSAITACSVALTSTVVTDAATVGGGTNGIFTSASPKIYSNMTGGQQGSAWQWSSGTANEVAVSGTSKIITITATSGTAVTGKITVLGR